MPRLPRARTCHWKCKFSFTCTSSHPTCTLAPHFPTYTLARMKKKLYLPCRSCTWLLPLVHLRTCAHLDQHPTPLHLHLIVPRTPLKLVALKSFLITIEMMVVTEPKLRVLFGSVTLCPKGERQICSERHFLQPPSPHLQQDHHLDLHNHHIQFIIKRNAHFPCPKHKPMDLQYFFSFRCWCILREAVVMMKDRHRTRWWWRSAPPAWFAEQTSGGGV